MNAVELTVNGRKVSAEVEPRTHLADFLRERELLTGTHLGCEHGICGACTVLIDGEPARSCITYPASLDGAEITTIEGFEEDKVMAALREAFQREHALQCGYCTPGMLVMARDIVLRLKEPDTEKIRYELSGNLCRCTGYVGIVRAIESTILAHHGAGKDAVAGGAVAGGAAAAAAMAPRRALSDVAPPAVTLSEEEAGPVSSARLEELKFENTEDGATRITQAFVVGFPRKQVWDFFQDPRKVVGCMPGASLSEVHADGRVAGEMRIRLGPMGASFAGEGEMASEPESFSGTITGRGKDTSSSTRASGLVHYRLEEADGGGATRVAVSVEYTLMGPLAQVSRGGIARDLAGRLTRTFAENLEASLSGREIAKGNDELGAGTLLLAVIRDWLRRLFGRG
ncbi:xanthine dehydrogenase family Fe-S subunit [Afifella pfennigii]|uniref:xanthine dehydrogenase family Fe-S subunit n=1 Tax=Afifella pfennigii TaxID=209897 RepID=UPI00047C4A63|nr:2Fe-2S iron-sulfur cluster-binding protein [Afifella pfennigii]